MRAILPVYRSSNPLYPGGWVRLFYFGRFQGPGVTWVVAESPMNFSERYGYVWFVTAFGRRWKVVPCRWER